jgi:hypothetical protein
MAARDLAEDPVARVVARRRLLEGDVARRRLDKTVEGGARLHEKGGREEAATVAAMRSHRRRGPRE